MEWHARKRDLHNPVWWPGVSYSLDLPADQVRLAIKRLDKANGSAERAFHPRNQIVDQRLIHHELAIGEELHQVRRDLRDVAAGGSSSYPCSPV